MRRANGSLSISRACDLLSKREGDWRGKKPKTLERRYRAAKKRLDDFRQRRKFPREFPPDFLSGEN